MGGNFSQGPESIHIQLFFLCVCSVLYLSVVSLQLFVTAWTAAPQAPLPMGILQARILEWVVRPSSMASF